MSRQRQQIEKFCKKVGINIVELIWEPLGKDGEMVGRSGGWILIDEYGDDYLGTNISELLANIKTHIDIQKLEERDREYEYWSAVGMRSISTWLKQNKDKFPFLENYDIGDPKVIPSLVMALIYRNNEKVYLDKERGNTINADIEK
jgi:hypothetical protein